MDKKKKKNSGNWNNQKKNQQNIENNNASNRSKEFRFDNSNYQNPDYEKQKQKAINEIKSREIICPKCNMPITDVSSAMADKVTGKPVHFDCVLAQLKQNERVGENEKIAYIGNNPAFCLVVTYSLKPSAISSSNERLSFSPYNFLASSYSACLSSLSRRRLNTT